MTTTVAPVPPNTSGAPVVTDETAPLDQREDIGVTVRPGDTLSRLCLSVYGSCDNGILRLVLESNPQIHSANFIVSGDRVVFPSLPAGTNSDNK
jgi:phage tail protein X